MPTAPTPDCSPCGGRPCCPAAWWRQRLVPWVSVNQVWIIGALWVVAYLLGWWGIREELRALGEERSTLEPFYRAFQLFLMDDGMVVMGPIHSWALEWARFLAPLVAGYTAVVALLALFQERVQNARLQRARGHVIVCGLGRRGLEIARHLRAQGRQVGAVEMDAENDGIVSCRQLGIAVLVGDATDAETLARAGLARAERLIVTTGTDGTNVETAVVAMGVVRNSGRPPSRPLSGMIHVNDPALWQLLSHRLRLAGEGSAFDLTVFNVYESAARQLLQLYPLDRDGIAADSPADVHLAIVGFGQMGENLALRAARIGHYANGARLRISIVDRQANARLPRFFARYPAVKHLCDVDCLEAQAESQDALDLLARAARTPHRWLSVVIAFDNDAAALALAVTLRSVLAATPSRILVRLADRGGLSLLLDSGAAGLDGVPVHPYGSIGDVCAESLALEERLDTIARLLHEAPPARAPVPAPPWHALEPRQRELCRQQADHLPVKLRAIGCYLAPADDATPSVTEFSLSEIEVLARLEHARQQAAVLLSPGPSEPELATGSWEALSEPARTALRQTVQHLPSRLRQAGQAICRRKSAVSDGRLA